ncbi:MAG: type II toxin-antitoxin system YafQ family toxin [Parachlamydiaceae bacterium]|nr:type II toxin-antitoxin system YafQ family toxin [Parachlamydiaceae bacterium]
MLNISFRTQFKKELKKQANRGKDIKKFLEIANKLSNETPLEPKYRNHKLVGNFKDRWECHIEPDWLLIYLKTSNEIVFERTGTHSDLFR